MEIPFDEIAGALVQHPEFAEREVIEITSTLDEMSSENRTRGRAGDFRGPWLPFLTIPGDYAVLAFDNLHREVFEVQFLAADDTR